MFSTFTSSELPDRQRQTKTDKNFTKLKRRSTIIKTMIEVHANEVAGIGSN